MMVFNRLCDPRSKLGMLQWLQTVSFPKATMQDVAHTQLLRAMDDWVELESKATDVIARLMRPLIDTDLSVVFYDVTTIEASGESEVKDDIRAHGRSKRDRIERQFALGLVQTAEGLPIAYEVFKGNVAEVSTLLPMVERVLERFDIKRVVLVADRGLLSMDNLEALAKIRLPSDCPLEFVLAVPARRYAEFAPLIETMGAGLEADWVREDRWPSGPDRPSLRLVVSHNETAARELTSQRRDRIRMLEEQAQRWASKLDAQDEGGRSRGRKLSDSGAKARFFHAVADAHLSSILQVDLKSDLCSLGISTRPCSSVTKRSTASSCCSPTSPISRPMRSSNATRAWLTSSADSAYSRARSRSVPSFIDGLIGFVHTPASVFSHWCSIA
jgi:hypothetical protein